MTVAVRAQRVPGEAGTWVFLFGDMVLFQVFFTTFLHERGTAPTLFDHSRRTLDLGIGLANTLVLLSSSLLVATAIRVIRRGAGRAASRMLSVAALCGLTFIGLKVVEYTLAVSHHHGPSVNTFYLYYFILTGLHLFHVVLGTVVLVLLAVQARRPELSAKRMMLVEGGACFWHLVDLLWIFLFPLLYLAS